MAEKVLKTRIKLLYKSVAEWESIKSTFIPLAGELCIAVDGDVALLKVGDGVKTYGQLDVVQAVASDVHAWAKKEYLDWADLDEDFKAALKDYLNIDNKTDRKLEGANGTALIFNESDGGGAKFENKDGVYSFTGVNDGGRDGITGQLYTVDKNNGNVGTRLNMTLKGFFYTNGKVNATYDADDEIATKGDIKALGTALHYEGAVVKEDGETDLQALERAFPDATAGAVAIVGAKEYLYNGTTWQEFGDEGLYETKAEAEAAHEALKQAITDLENALRAEIAKKTDRELNGANGKALIFNESDGGGAKFEHNDGTWSFVGVNDGGENGITGQIYSVKKNAEGKYEGVRLNMTNEAFYYMPGSTSSAAYTADNEIATKGDITNALDDILIIDGNV